MPRASQSRCQPYTKPQFWGGKNSLSLGLPKGCYCSWRQRWHLARFVSLPAGCSLHRMETVIRSSRGAFTTHSGKDRRTDSQMIHVTVTPCGQQTPTAVTNHKPVTSPAQRTGRHPALGSPHNLSRSRGCDALQVGTALAASRLFLWHTRLAKKPKEPQRSLFRGNGRCQARPVTTARIFNTQKETSD